MNRIRGMKLDQSPAPIPQSTATPVTVTANDPITVAANDPNTVVAGGNDDSAIVILPEAEDLTKRFGTFNPRLKGQFRHTDPNDEYFSAGQMSQRRERHPPGYNFLGPGTEFEARMIGLNGDFYKFAMERAGRKPRGTYPYDEPFNDVDACAMEHDRIFTKQGTTKEDAEQADRVFEKCLYEKPRTQQVYTEAIRDMAAMAIKIKGYALSVSGSDDPFLAKKEQLEKVVNNNFQVAVDETNMEIDSALEQSNYWIITLMYYLQIPALTRIGIQTGVKLTATVLTQAARLYARRRIDVSQYVANPIVRNEWIAKLAGILRISHHARRAMLEHVSALIGTGGGETVNEAIGALFETSTMRGTIASNTLRQVAHDILLKRMEGYFDWYEEGWKSDEWRAQNVITEQTVREQADRSTSTRDDLRDLVSPERPTAFSNRYGISRDNDNMKEMRKLMSQTYQSSAEKGDAIIKILTELRLESTTTKNKNSIIPVLKEILNNANNNIMAEMYSYQSSTSSLRLKTIERILSRKLIPQDISSFLKIESLLKNNAAGFRQGMTTDEVRAQLAITSYKQMLSMFDFFDKFHNLFN